MPELDDNLLARLKNVRLLAMDVDGVLTDGRIHWFALADGSPLEGKSFHVRDGLGISVALAGGLEIAWITGRVSPIVQRRAHELRVRHLVQWARDKQRVLRELAEQVDIPLAETAFLGDDWNDWPAMEAAGVGIAVADAPTDLRERAEWVTGAPGGEGAVREAIETLLRAQGRWEEALEKFFSRLRGEHDKSPPGIAG